MFLETKTENRKSSYYDGGANGPMAFPPESITNLILQRVEITDMTMYQFYRGSSNHQASENNAWYIFL